MAHNFYCVTYYQTRQGTSPSDWRTSNIDQQTSSMFAHGFYCLNSKTSDPPADGLTYSLPLQSTSCFKVTIFDRETGPERQISAICLHRTRRAAGNLSLSSSGVHSALQKFCAVVKTKLDSLAFLIVSGSAPCQNTDF